MLLLDTLFGYLFTRYCNYSFDSDIYPSAYYISHKPDRQAIETFLGDLHS